MEKYPLIGKLLLNHARVPGVCKQCGHVENFTVHGSALTQHEFVPVRVVAEVEEVPLAPPSINMLTVSPVYSDGTVLWYSHRVRGWQAMELANLLGYQVVLV